MEDITDRIVEVDRLASETGILHIGLTPAVGRTLERVCRTGAPVEVSSPGSAPAELARDGAGLVADFAVLARKGTMSTAIPEGAFIHRGQIVIMTGLEQPSIHEVLMGGELAYEEIDGRRQVRYDDLVAFMEKPHGTSGSPPRQAGVAFVLATGEANRAAVQAAGDLEPGCGGGGAVGFRNRYGLRPELEPAAAGVLARFLHQLAMARMVSILPKHARLTRGQAAAASHKQPSYIDKVLASGELRSIEADDGHIVRYNDLMAFAEAYRRRAREGMKKIQRLGEEMRIEMEERDSHVAAARRGISLARSP